MSWLQLRIVCDRDQSPLIEAALETSGAHAVSLDDDGDEPQLEPLPGTTPLWSRVRITALFADDDVSREVVASLMQMFARQGFAAEVEPLTDQAWERAWMIGIEPMRFGKRLWISPRGAAVDLPGSVVVELDPGLAFGTGHHPTTAMCLELLDEIDLAGKTLLDYGCGSGILAVAALKLGAGEAVAVDYDPQALTATRTNAAHNQVEQRMHCYAPAVMPIVASEVTVANILAGPLIELAPILAHATRPNGVLGLSGILLDQAESVVAAYRDYFRLEPPRIRDDWVMLRGRRKGST